MHFQDTVELYIQDIESAADNNPNLLSLIFCNILYGSSLDDLNLSASIPVYADIQNLTRECTLSRSERLHGALKDASQKFHTFSIREDEEVLTHEAEVSPLYQRRWARKRVEEKYQEYTAAAKSAEDKEGFELVNDEDDFKRLLEYVASAIFFDMFFQTDPKITRSKKFDAFGYVVGLLSSASLFFYGRKFFLEEILHGIDDDTWWKEGIAILGGLLAYLMTASLNSRFNAQRVNAIFKPSSAFKERYTKRTWTVWSVTQFIVICSIGNSPELAAQVLPFPKYMKVFFYVAAATSPFLGNSQVLNSAYRDRAIQYLQSKKVPENRRDLNATREEIVKRLKLATKIIKNKPLDEKHELYHDVYLMARDKNQSQHTRNKLKRLIKETYHAGFRTRQDVLDEFKHFSGKPCSDVASLITKGTFKVIATIIPMLAYQTNVRQAMNAADDLFGETVSQEYGLGYLMGVCSITVNGTLGALAMWNLIDHLAALDFQDLGAMNCQKISSVAKKLAVIVLAGVNSSPSIVIVKRNPPSWLGPIAPWAPYLLFMTNIVLFTYAIFSLYAYLTEQKDDLNEFRRGYDNMDDFDRRKLGSLYDKAFANDTNQYIKYIEEGNIDLIQYLEPILLEGHATDPSGFVPQVPTNVAHVSTPLLEKRGSEITYSEKMLRQNQKERFMIYKSCKKSDGYELIKTSSSKELSSSTESPNGSESEDRVTDATTKIRRTDSVVNFSATGANSSDASEDVSMASSPPPERASLAI